jgi:hypothetical protein
LQRILNVVCKSQKEALKRRAELAAKMGWKEDNAPKPKPVPPKPPQPKKK